MKRIGYLLKKDMILGIKDIFILLEIIFAVFIMLLLLFLIPEDIKIEGTVYIYDKPGIVEQFVENSIGLEEMEKQRGEFYVDSREELIAGMEENRSALGLILDQTPDGTYSIELLTQPYTSEWIVRYIEMEMEDLMSILHPPYGAYPMDVYESLRITSLQWGLRDELPFNQRVLPPIIFMMVGVMGMFAMVSLIGQERTDLTLRAYRVAPGSLMEFIASKHLVIIITSMICFSILYLPMMGFRGFLPAMLITFLTVVMGSTVGIILGSFFRNPMSAMLWIMLMLIVLALPVISLFSPIFSPFWLQLIPSFHTVFGLDAAMFPDNNSHMIWRGVIILAIIDVIMLPLSTGIFSRKIGKEA